MNLSNIRSNFLKKKLATKTPHCMVPLSIGMWFSDRLLTIMAKDLCSIPTLALRMHTGVSCVIPVRVHLCKVHQQTNGAAWCVSKWRWERWRSEVDAARRPPRVIWLMMHRSVVAESYPHMYSVLDSTPHSEDRKSKNLFAIALTPDTSFPTEKSEARLSPFVVRKRDVFRQQIIRDLCILTLPCSI